MTNSDQTAAVKSSFGAIDKISNSNISGWVHHDISESQELVLKISGVGIRTQRAETHEPHRSRRRFKFYISDPLLELIPSNAKVEVIASGFEESLPIETDEVLTGLSNDAGEKLRERLEGKWRVDHWGIPRVTFATDPSLVARCADIYERGCKFFDQNSGKILYVTGGNLLGLIREGKFIDHDDDIDASIVFDAVDADDAARKFFEFVHEIAPEAYAADYRLRVAGPLHLYFIRDGLPYLDVLCGWYCKEKDYWCRPSGYGGVLGVSEFKYSSIEYAGVRMNIPDHYARELELTYGDTWHTKDAAYSKVRPKGPLDDILRLQRRYKNQVKETNTWLEGLSGGKGLEK